MIRRRPGRPRIADQPLQSVSVSVYPADYDELCRMALRHDRTVSAVVRVAIRRWLKTQDSFGDTSA